MVKKVIQVPFDEGLLRDMDNLSKKRRKARSALIREACQDYLLKIEENELDRAYREGYERLPEEAGLGEVQSEIISQVVPEESW